MPHSRHLLMATALLAGAVALRAQQAPTFRSQVEAVEVDAFVVDRAGSPVSDLRQSDFEVLEDGKPQTITSFSLVDIPITGADPYSPTAPDPDVATNLRGEGRLYVVAVDDVAPDVALRARHVLHTFFERHFEPNDTGIVVHVGHASAASSQDFTGNRRLLLAAVDRIQGWPPDSTTPAAARQRAAALRDLMRALAGISGRRKALIYVTQSASDVFSVIDYHGGVRTLEQEDLHAAMTDAMRSGVAIYTVDPAGITSGASGESESAPAAADAGAELDRLANLREMANATGGFAVVNSNSFESSFARMVRENSTYYVLGFTSTNDRRDERYRKLDVRVKRPGLTVRHRDGYIAPSAKQAATRAPSDEHSVLAAPVRDAVRSPLAAAAVPMSVFASAFRREAAHAASVVVSLEMDPTRLNLVSGPAATSGQVEVAVVAVSAKGKLAGGHHDVFTLQLRPDTWRRASTDGVRLITSLPLPPGRYQLRVAAANTASTSGGSVMYDLDVPDFSKGALTMSAPALTSGVTAPVLVRPGGITRVVTIEPTVARDFPAGTPVSLYVEVYDNGKKKDLRPIDLTLAVRDGTGRVLSTSTQHRNSIGGTQVFTVPVPLDLAPGAYAVHVEATTPALKEPISRDIPIRVR